MEKITYLDITDQAIEEIYQLTGQFHDNCVDICEYANDVLRLEINNPWGNNIEFRFSGDIAYFMDMGYLEARGDRSWWKGTIFSDNGYFYLVDQIYATVEDTKDALCWFRGKTLQYRIIVN